MPQGAKCTGLKASASRKGVKIQKGGGKKSKKKGEANARYKAVTKPKSHTGIEAYKRGQIVTKKINANIEKVMAAKVCQAGERLNMRDILSVGKEHSKELRRAALKKQKPRVEEKMEAFKAKLDRLQGNDFESGPSAKRQKT